MILYEKALNDVASRLGMTCGADEPLLEFNLRVRRVARQRDRKLARWLNHEFSSYMDRVQGPSNLC